MAGKGAKKRNSKDSTGSKEKKKGGKKKNGRSAGGSSSAKSSKIQGDIFSEGAMENAYLICHNVQVIDNNYWKSVNSMIKKKKRCPFFSCNTTTIFHRMF